MCLLSRLLGHGEILKNIFRISFKTLNSRTNAQRARFWRPKNKEEKDWHNLVSNKNIFFKSKQL